METKDQSYEKRWIVPRTCKILVISSKILVQLYCTPPHEPRMICAGEVIFLTIGIKLESGALLNFLKANSNHEKSLCVRKRRFHNKF